MRLPEPPRSAVTGAAGEAAAARELARRGGRVLARNYRTRSGEIDLVARFGRELAAVEVKTRRAPAAGREAPRPADRIDGRRLARLERALGDFAAAHGLADAPRRIDVVEVLLDASGAVAGLRHLEDVTR